MFTKMNKEMKLWGSWHGFIRPVEYTSLLNLIPQSCDGILSTIVVVHKNIVVVG
jgi:hypothetical protein